jgi:hypothetical protein
MSTYIDLDSLNRDFLTYPNPAQYDATGPQINTWTKAPRTVMANSSRPSNKSIEFVEDVEVIEFVLPYGNYTYVNAAGATITSNTANLQRVYLDVHNPFNNDLRLIYSMNDVVSHARFVLLFDSVQFATTTGNPGIWVKFKCKMNQVMRFTRNEPIIVRIMQEQGFTITIADTNPPTFANQTYILLKITPYFIDGNYNNQGLGLTQLL